MRRFAVQHVTRYSYESPVERSYGRAHLRPRDDDGQTCLESSLDISPLPSEIRDHLDYFGNISTYYLVRRAHTSLTVTARSTLEVSRAAPSASSVAGSPTVRETVAATATEPLLAEYRLGSPRVAVTPAVRAYGDATLAADRPVLEAVHDLFRQIHADFGYRSGSTTVRTTVDEVLRQRSGVCQDFAQLAVACLRSVGLAARYVSGYLETQPPPGKVKLKGADASHAWAAVHCPGLGWVEFDPTNDHWVDDRYLVLAHGRDYGDVAPLKGIIVTESRSSVLRVSVDVTAL